MDPELLVKRRMRNTIAVLLVAVLATPAFAGPKNKKEGGEAAPAPAPSEAKKAKKKDKKEEAPTPPPAPAPDSKGTLKPGQGVGVRGCLGSSNNINIEATSKSTVGVQTCRSALERMFVDKGLCKTKGAKVKYSWQFADTTGDHEFTCR
ncbi:MAG: hypothetical protein ABI867_11530 [Kofleriaceae bacterium]